MNENKPIVGVVGLGIMGSAFSKNLLEKGFRVIGFDVAPKAREHAAQLGVVIADSPRAVGEQSDCVLSSLPTAAAFCRDDGTRWSHQRETTAGSDISPVGGRGYLYAGTARQVPSPRSTAVCPGGHD